MIKKEAEKILHYKDLTIEVQCMWTKNKSNTSNNWGNWSQLKVINKRADQSSRKAQLQKMAQFGIEHILQKVQMFKHIINIA